MPTAVVRVNEPTHEILRELARESDKSMSFLLSLAVEDLRRKKFMEAVNEEYRVLRADAIAWAAEQNDRTAWDTTLTDGLDK
jgi:predicted transcriptional regulator